MEAIRRELLSQEVENSDNKVFVPISTLKTILIPNAVASLLKATAIEFYHHEELTRIITSKALRIFATLIYIGEIDAIHRFVEHDHSTQPHLDSKLPFEENALVKVWDNGSTRKAFCRSQWIFCAPFIEPDQSHRYLHERTVLPYLSRLRIGSGGFADVYKVKVAAFQHELAKPPVDIELACKEIRAIQSDTKLSFLNETRILSLLRCLQHPSIIRLVMGYTIGDTHSLLFPLAQGDLRRFLTLEDRPPRLQEDCEILEALWGLSSAIAAVHNYFADAFDVRKVGCHYDIKPRNILYLDGRFLLSDFGLSRLRDETEGSKSQFKDIEGDYLAPECEDKEGEYQKGMPGRMSDVWSFGCILSELLAFLSSGPQRVKEYAKQRRTRIGPEIGSFFFAAGPQVNPAVLNLLNSSFSDQELASLAQLIQQILQIDPNQRLPAQLITSSLFNVSLQPIIREICATLEAGKSELEVDVELQRFRIWLQAIGLESCSNAWIRPDETWLSQNHDFKEYIEITQTLREIQKEARAVCELVQRQETPAHQYCFHLQRLQDRLWDAQPHGLCDRMNMQLERLLLNEHEVVANVQHVSMGNHIQESGTLRFSSQKCASTRLYRRIRLLSLMQRVSEVMTSSSDSAERPLLHSADLRVPFESFHSHYLSEYLPNQRPVLIEKLVYSEAWTNRTDELVARVQSIAALHKSIGSDNIRDVQRTFLLLECCGYYHRGSSHEFGIVYFLPAMSTYRKPMSLWNILKKTQKINSTPSLTTRFTIASKLVRSIHDLHAGGWFHKSISSHNILVFPADDKNPAQQIEDLYLIGFNLSRVNNDTAFTEGPGIGDDLKDYQHPKYLKAQRHSSADSNAPSRRFRPEFDYYSIGLVLLEIGFWKPLEAIVQDLDGDPTTVMRSIVKHYVGLVKSTMGDFYADAVRVCLTCYNKDSVSVSDAQTFFERDVVQPISQRKI